MPRKKVPPEISAYMSMIGKKGAAKGASKAGKRSLETMTAEERSERARKAAAASAKVRSRKAAEKK